MINNHTYYSLKYGTYNETDLLTMAKQYGYDILPLTDINNTSACLNFTRIAPEFGIRPILGIDFRNGIEQEFVALAKNNEGFQEINAFLSHHLHSKTPIPQVSPHFKHASVVYPFNKLQILNKTTFKAHEYIGVTIKDLAKIPFSNLSLNKDRMVILHTSTFRDKKDFNTHRLLRAIDSNCLLSQLPEDNQGSEFDQLLSRKELEDAYKGFPFLIQNTIHFLNQHSINFDFSKSKQHQNKLHYKSNREEDITLLKGLCEKGITYRYKEKTKAIQDRIDKELAIITKMNYVPFFLINWDIIQYAKYKGYYHVGRGSGANSIIAYLLEITDVDPIDLDLYFERFMNLYRSNPPDFDIDFSWRDRPDVTEYIFRRFGQNNQVALLGTFNTFSKKAAIRELGKVFGLPNHDIEMLNFGKYDVSKLDHYQYLVHRYASFIEKFPSHLSIHAGGILISEKPIHYFSGTFLPPKGFPVTQFDMHIAEDIGLYKYDILGQRGLGKIKDALSIIRQNKPDAPQVDIHNVKPFLVDKGINDMVSRAECIGCFYVESPAMRMLLKKLSVNNYLGLVAASSIIRPGVAKSGMMREYILRHKKTELRESIHPVMETLMQETYGIMVYQEDVIKVAHHFAGLDLGEADVLRRAMSGKFRSRAIFSKIRDKFFDNCMKRGYDPKLTRSVWFQIESFAGYAFAKGHSASYAVESYQSLYLKHYYPLEFMVAVLNNGGGFYKPEIYIHETKILGGNVLPPCINHSLYETTIIGNDIYLGFMFLSKVDHKSISKILHERRENGHFTSLIDFMDRVHISLDHLEILIRINAFSFTCIKKHQLLWEAHLKYKPLTNTSYTLFDRQKSKDITLPTLEFSTLDHIHDEIEILGFPLCNPFDILKAPPTSTLKTSHMEKYVDKHITIYGYLVTLKSTKTHDGKYMYFGTFLDLDGQWLDTVHFPKIRAKYPARGSGIYKMTGQVVNEFDFLSLEVSSMIKMPYKDIE